MLQIQKKSGKEHVNNIELQVIFQTHPVLSAEIVEI